MTPTTLKAKEFEELLLEAARRQAKDGMLTMSRYGVQVALISGDWQPVPSLPDFEGVVAGGRQFICEAKVVSQPSFRMRKEFLKPRQVSHMLERSRFGVPCFLVVHFNERIGKTFHDAAETIALPVDDSWSIWPDYLAGEPVSPISRDMARRHGTKLDWTAPGKAKKPLPDLAALLGVVSPQAPDLL